MCRTIFPASSARHRRARSRASPAGSRPACARQSRRSAGWSQADEIRGPSAGPPQGPRQPRDAAGTPAVQDRAGGLGAAAYVPPGGLANVDVRRGGPLRHVARLVVICVTVLRYGLDELALSSFRQRSVRALVRVMTIGRTLDAPRGVRLRMGLERLGP